MISRWLKYAVLIAVAVILGACASNAKVVSLPISVQSHPLGAYVLLQVRNPDSLNKDDWIFVGNSPVTVTREYHKGVFEKTHSIRIKIVKEGYFSQTKEWSGDSLEKETEEKGKVFWNPKLVKQ
ncbi:hypothetical protein ACFL17_05520 [Pseudomonadota bacterium]